LWRTALFGAPKEALVGVNDRSRGASPADGYFDGRFHLPRNRFGFIRYNGTIEVHNSLLSVVLNDQREVEEKPVGHRLV